MFSLYQFLLYIFVTAYTPGPNNIMSLSNAVRYGFKKVFLSISVFWLGFPLLCYFAHCLARSYFHISNKRRFTCKCLGLPICFILSGKRGKVHPKLSLKKPKGQVSYLD